MSKQPPQPVLNLPRGRLLSLNEPVIMGILNVTPDSFSDGGAHAHPQRAIEFAMQMIRQGATIIDIGGESTRPGAQRIDAAQQIKRTVPVIQKLRASNEQVVISIDTTLSEVAQAALDAGADIINDVSAGEDDPRNFELAAGRNVPLILMHKQGLPATMQDRPVYDNVVCQVHEYLLQRAEIAVQAGGAKEQIVLDPGIGFGKTVTHNMALIGAMDRLVATGYAVLLGASRKRSLGAVCTMPNEPSPESATLVGATCSTTTLGVMSGVHIFRVHDVQANWQALQVSLNVRRCCK